MLNGIENGLIHAETVLSTCLHANLLNCDIKHQETTDYLIQLRDLMTLNQFAYSSCVQTCSHETALTFFSFGRQQIHVSGLLPVGRFF